MHRSNRICKDVDPDAFEQNTTYMHIYENGEPMTLHLESCVSPSYSVDKCARTQWDFVHFLFVVFYTIMNIQTHALPDALIRRVILVSNVIQVYSYSFSIQWHTNTTHTSSWSLYNDHNKDFTIRLMIPSRNGILYKCYYQLIIPRHGGYVENYTLTFSYQCISQSKDNHCSNEITITSVDS